MSDPISVTNLALSLSTKATEALNALRERAQTTNDLDVKNHISALYDIVLQLKEALSRLSDENKELKHKLENQQNPEDKPKIRQVGSTNYYYIGEDDGPYCQRCLDGPSKTRVRLSPQQTGLSGSISRSCPVCHQTFYEKSAAEVHREGREPYTWS
ncbi:MAG TPA: hypothetical protein VGS78_03740 [Candidatus Sulfotelmatobacter sp.]|nr:hypothetical protein [Candidatus Sulfotelmatobacter sp.]